MAIDDIRLASGPNLSALQDAVNVLRALGYRSEGPVSEVGGQLVLVMVDGSAPPTFEDLTARLEAIEAIEGLDELPARVTAIEDWSDTLAAKLNADEGVDDEDYVGVVGD